jgi:ABC-type multidrug transport system ATPase subunit
MIGFMFSEKNKMPFTLNNYEFRLQMATNTFLLSIPKFTLSKEEIIFLYGNSGSGKSTFFNLLIGIHESYINKNIRLFFQKIEYVMHESKLLPWRDLYHNILLINKLGGNISIENLLGYCLQFGLDNNILNLKSRQLSLGMRQRLEIAIALSNNSDLIILDEALSGIDYKHKLIVCTSLYNFVKKTKASLLCTAHQVSDILRLANRVIFLHDGYFTKSICISSCSVIERLDMSIKALYALPEAEVLLEFNEQQ